MRGGRGGQEEGEEGARGVPRVPQRQSAEAVALRRRARAKTAGGAVKMRAAGFYHIVREVLCGICIYIYFGMVGGES